MITKKEYRCKCCGKLFFKANIHRAEIEIKCRYCKQINDINALSEDNLSYSEDY